MDIEVKEKIVTDVFKQNHATVYAPSIHKFAILADQAYFPKGSMILEIKQPQSYIYLITKGLARSFVTNENGDNSVKNFMSEGDFLIGESLFSDTSMDAFDTLEDTYCLRFEAKELKKIILSDQNLMNFYIEVLEETLRYKMQREYAFQNLDATARYMEFREQFGSLEKRIPQNQIASYIGIAKESLSRLRKKL